MHGAAAARRAEALGATFDSGVDRARLRGARRGERDRGDRATGLCSAVLDNAPTYAAFSALAAGLSQGQPDLVAGVTPLKLAAVSAGSVVMGATTYIGNAPN